MLTANELERYARHIVLREVGGPGQTALKEASVLVIGAGGLGAPVLMYLAAAGVGTLGVVDDDIVSLSNLQRQIIHTTRDVGRRKVDSAAEVIDALNPHVHFEAHALRLDAGNAGRGCAPPRDPYAMTALEEERGDARTNLTRAEDHVQLVRLHDSKMRLASLHRYLLFRRILLQPCKLRIGSKFVSFSR